VSPNSIRHRVLQAVQIPLRCNEIATAVNIRHNYASSELYTILDKGYVEQTQIEGSKRYRWQITDAGREVLGELG